MRISNLHWCKFSFNKSPIRNIDKRYLLLTAICVLINILGKVAFVKLKLDLLRVVAY